VAPWFVLTTSGAEEDRQAAYRNHVAGYVRKSAAGEDFIDMVTLLEQFWKLVDLPIRSFLGPAE
jgi:DNA-binding NarL/FixJ family response regulator